MVEHCILCLMLDGLSVLAPPHSWKYFLVHSLTQAGRYSDRQARQ